MKIFPRTLLSNFDFSFADNLCGGMVTSVNKKVLILGHSFVWHLATDLRRECVDWAVATFNVSEWMYECME